MGFDLERGPFAQKRCPYPLLGRPEDNGKSQVNRLVANHSLSDLERLSKPLYSELG